MLLISRSCVHSRCSQQCRRPPHPVNPRLHVYLRALRRLTVGWRALVVRTHNRFQTLAGGLVGGRRLRCVGLSLSLGLSGGGGVVCAGGVEGGARQQHHVGHLAQQ
jgi:hypothetical protein